MSHSRYGSGCGCDEVRVTGCGCNNTPYNSPLVGITLKVDNSWNVPAIGEDVELIIPGASNVQVGSSIYNPFYGTYLINSFSSSRQAINVENLGYGNPAPGTPINSGAFFSIRQPLFTKKGTWPITYQAVGSMLFTPSSEPIKEYWSQEDLVTFKAQMIGIITGTPSSSIVINPPIKAAGYEPGFGGNYVQGSTYDVLKAGFVDPTSLGLPAGDPVISIQKRDNSNFALGATTLTVFGFYKPSFYNI